MKKPYAGTRLLLCLSLFISSYSFSQAPANNACASAVLIAGPSYCTTGTIVNATPDFTGSCSGTVKYDVWYTFVAKSTNPTIALSNVGTNFSNQTPRLQLYSGNCGALTSITCGGTALTGSQLTVNNTYYVRVYSITGNAVPTSNAGFTICVTDPAPLVSSRMAEVFLPSTLSGTNLIDDPWEVLYGPDDSLWITEAKGYKVYKMDPVTGNKVTILDLSNSATGYLTASEHTAFNRQFNIGTNNPQGGLAGMVLHPDWATKKYVYISYVHTYNSSAANYAGVFFTNRIVRFTYNTSTGKLQNPVSICDTIPGSSDHNSQRMIIAPVGGVNYLFYAAGDMGAGQFGNVARPIKAQITASYEGKILRFNLEDDGDVNATTPMDKWIPNTNPFNTTSPAKQSAVWCTGIRNNQGFAFGNGKLYGSSHGPYSDDEINIFDAGKNYGHPFVIGKDDGNYNGSKAGNNYKTGSPVVTYNTIMPLITDEVANAAAITNYTNPMYTGYASTQAEISSIWTGAPDNTIPNGDWPSEGWSGMDLYNHTLIPGWKNSLILGSLKWGRVLRFKLNGSSSGIDSIGGHDTLSYFGSRNRFRDMAISPNGKDIFIVMDKSETTSGPSAANPRVSACNGCVQKYTFLGYNDASGESSIPATIPVTGGATNSCRTGTSITIDANNNSIWVPITGPDGNIVAEINANGQNLGMVQSSFYTHSGTTRITGGRRFLNRNIFIDPTTAPASAVKVRLYITKAELDSLIAAGGATNITSLRILQNNNVCSSSPTGAATEVNPPIAKLHGTSAYVLQANVTLGNASSFYFANGNYVLPLDLITFTGSLKNNTAALKWITENEVNTSHFIVQRSVDGTNFTAIGNVKAAGNGSSSRSYTLYDKEIMSLQAGVVYYKIQIVDGNGQSKQSNVVALSVEDRNTIVSVSPNPVSTTAKVHVKPTGSGQLQWKLIDNGGRTIRVSQVQVRKSVTNIFEVNMTGLAHGAYYLQLFGAGVDTRVKLQKM